MSTKSFCDGCGEEINPMMPNALLDTVSMFVDSFGGQHRDLCQKCAENVLHHIDMLKVSDSISYFKNGIAIGYATNVDKICPLIETVRGHQ